MADEDLNSSGVVVEQPTAEEQQQEEQQQQQQEEVTANDDKNNNNNNNDHNGGFTEDAGVARWLLLCAGVVFGIVVVGGTTRLTRSGLSMVEWRFHGKRLPSTDEEWQEEFDKYKKFPEFRRLNFDMTVDEFKNIYFWEWFHRMLGRSAGVVFALPALYFASRGRIKGKLAKRLALAFGMGGAQGLVGWWMVKSGLEEQENPYAVPRVSPYRLTAHMASAFAIYSVLLDTTMKVWPKKGATSLLSRLQAAPRPFRAAAIGVAHLVGITALSGAFVAGNQAGLIYNEFPKMGGRWVPEDIVDPALKPAWKNVFENSTMVQFDHRVLAMSTLTAVTALWAFSRRVPLSRGQRAAVNTALAVCGTQVTLGIATLLLLVPVELGVAHQAGALTLWSTFLWLMHTLGPKEAHKVLAQAARRIK
eukprot:TRINITY_DN66072_c3_g3_i1.p1 TRINITY_DN66072_c3_g3~~TRINITY_DN66072_c3_g3_i1.p1  ORF type:complete len:428 (+),score=204.94 TRINITY_DN66072_c3_g3_i1:31-1284(+)